MMGSWGARLAIYLIYTRKPRGGGANFPSVWRLAAYAVAAVSFSLPALFVSANPLESFSVVELIAAGIWLIAFCGEAADRQRIGRYAFEFMIWIAYALFAAASPWGWIAVACPVAVGGMLLRRSRVLAQLVL